MASSILLGCKKCGAAENEPCVSRTGRKTSPHTVRREACAKWVREEYCRNEVLSGYGCGGEGCPHCGGFSGQGF